MDWFLVRNQDGTFLAVTDYHTVDIKYLAPTLTFTINPFKF